MSKKPGGECLCKPVLTAITVSLEFTTSKGNGTRTTRINAKDTNALTLQLLAEPFREHGACGIGLRIGGPFLVGLSIL